MPDKVEAELSADEARRLALRAQGLLGADGRRGGVPGMLARLGAVQLDTISVLARSHELVPYARLGAVARDRIETAYWGPSAGGGRAAAFEYWAHAASILPIEEWPTLAFRRRQYQRKGLRWHKVPDGVCDEIRAKLKAEGPLTTKELGGAKAGGDWWQWSDHKIGIEWLWDVGEVACVQRIGWRRVYDLAERVVPDELYGQEPDDAACLTRLVRLAGRALGVATRADLADYYRLKGEQVDAVVEASGLVPVRVQGWPQAAWADPDALAVPPRGRHVTTLLSPFDSLVWDRARTSRVFGFDHRLEAYVPKAKRVHGYFTMPLLAGGRLVGRVDPAREGTTLVARQVSLEPGLTRSAVRLREGAEALRTALRNAAEWVGCDAIRVERADPEVKRLVEAE
ncbi:winged helix-turn-helix domain-containing protein [Actinomadura logoneensis]|uniref:Winged helix-turn-helix domain-containing protein n=2 Tax=Actinomadura logoneensis TaxID=2293572 RepID=A0A372JJJ4_9ACTN|nr:winged helix-turn-helix domain-containing protein [Actinomadura logoneensis]